MSGIILSRYQTKCEFSKPSFHIPIFTHAFTASHFLMLHVSKLSSLKSQRNAVNARKKPVSVKIDTDIKVKLNIIWQWFNLITLNSKIKLEFHSMLQSDIFFPSSGFHLFFPLAIEMAEAVHACMCVCVCTKGLREILEREFPQKRTKRGRRGWFLWKG